MAKKEERLEWAEHLGKAFEAFFRDLRGILPEETYKHLGASRKEFLLAIRSVIDREVQKVEEEEKKRVRKVKVQ